MFGSVNVAVAVQSGAVLEDDVQPGAVLDQVQTEAVLDHVQTEAALDQVVQPEIPPLSRVVVRPSEGDAKKTRSMNDLLGIEAKASRSRRRRNQMLRKSDVLLLVLSNLCDVLLLLL